MLGLGTDTFPAFYTPHSGLAVPVRVADATEAAAVARAHWSLGGAGVVLAVPIPAADALPGEEIEPVIQRAVALAGEQGVHGPAWTPFVLDQIRQLTGGRSVTANVALVKHNATQAPRRPGPRRGLSPAHQPAGPPDRAPPVIQVRQRRRHGDHPHAERHGHHRVGRQRPLREPQHGGPGGPPPPAPETAGGD